jgi:hypothetical protein
VDDSDLLVVKTGGLHIKICIFCLAVMTNITYKVHSKMKTTLAQFLKVSKNKSVIDIIFDFGSRPTNSTIELILAIIMA